MEIPASCKVAGLNLVYRDLTTLPDVTLDLIVCSYRYSPAELGSTGEQLSTGKGSASSMIRAVFCWIHTNYEASEIVYGASYLPAGVVTSKMHGPNLRWQVAVHCIAGGRGHVISEHQEGDRELEHPTRHHNIPTNAYVAQRIQRPNWTTTQRSPYCIAATGHRICHCIEACTRAAPQYLRTHPRKQQPRCQRRDTVATARP